MKLDNALSPQCRRVYGPYLWDADRDPVCLNEHSVDEKLSERMRDRYNLFGSLPDTIKDERIDDI